MPLSAILPPLIGGALIGAAVFVAAMRVGRVGMQQLQGADTPAQPAEAEGN